MMTETLIAVEPRRRQGGALCVRQGTQPELRTHTVG